MKLSNILELVLLSALWGASFLFMRVTVDDFGAISLIFLRISIAALFLLPFVIWQNQLTALKMHFAKMTLLGVFNSAIPFTLIAYSTLYLTAGFASILNAVTPMCSALVAWFWLRTRLKQSALFGLLVGFSGVVVLVWDKVGFDMQNTTLAIIAGIGAALCYGISANYSKKYMPSVAPLALATGTLIGASICLLPLAAITWPASSPSTDSWLMVSILAVVCTGSAYILYFRLIANVGPANATLVTFLIPIFGMLWGAMILGEPISAEMLVGCLIILAGTGLTIGLVQKLKLKVFSR